MYKDFNTFILRLEDNSSIPKDNDNIDYQIYLEWVEKNEYDPWKSQES